MATSKTCGNCNGWKFMILNQVWGSCKKILYCEAEDYDLDLPVISYTYCEGEDLAKPALEHRLVLETPKGHSCVLWEEKS